MQDKILVINPGSTSTKVALFAGDKQRWLENSIHDAAKLAARPLPRQQLAMRRQTVAEVMHRHGDDTAQLHAVVARGGMLPGVSSGAYAVTPYMLDTLEKRPVLNHISNLAAAIAYDIAQAREIPCYIYDPVTVDEMLDIARITGIPAIQRMARGHNLNMRACAVRYCRERQLAYAGVNLIVAHLGGGATFSLHAGGRIADMISDDDGAFSPERCGRLPAYELVRFLFERRLTYDGAMKLLQHGSGLSAHLGTTDMQEAEKRIQAGDAQAQAVVEAMALAAAKAVAELAVVVDGRVDAILLTGGMAYSGRVTSLIKNRVQFIAPVTVFPGENEMQALAEGCLRVMRKEETAKIYGPEQQQAERQKI